MTLPTKVSTPPSQTFHTLYNLIVGKTSRHLLRGSAGYDFRSALRLKNSSWSISPRA